jgi:hypothetical protein
MRSGAITPNSEASASASPRAVRVRPNANVFTFAILGLGTIINVGAYMSLLPAVLGFALFALGTAMATLPRLGGRFERAMFSRVFAVGFLMAGVAAFYRNYFGDANVDAIHFFEWATGQRGTLSLTELFVFSEGSLAILLWRTVYEVLGSVGVPQKEYVGILVNVTLVAFTGVVAVKMARMVYGRDQRRLQRLTRLFAFCGLFWLFASLFLRDAFVLLIVTGLAYGWVAFLTSPGFGRGLLTLIGLNLAGGIGLGLLRTEFIFVPIAMAVAGVCALMFSSGRKRNRGASYILIMLGLVAVGWLAIAFGDAVSLALFGGRQDYLRLAADEHSTDSLGMSLVIAQPLPIRVVVGSVYLFVYPIPFWAGLKSVTAYGLFDSFNALFFYLVVPLLVLAVWQVLKSRTQRTAPVLFLVFSAIGFVLAIAGTSLETRHLGAFLGLTFVLAILPDLRVRAMRQQYRLLLATMLVSVVVVHVMWVVLKLGY